MRRRTILRDPVRAVVVIACLSHSVSAGWWPFPPKRFSGNGMLSAGPLGLEDEDRIIAFGDFNGDQYLDVLTLGGDGRTLGVSLWNHEAFVFHKTAQFRHTQPVHNVIPGDFTQDGKVDLLVVGDGDTRDQLSMSLYIGTVDGGFEPSPGRISPSADVQPIGIDVGGDMRIDLFGHVAGGSSDFKVWKNVWNNTNPDTRLFEVSDARFKGRSCRMANPHSNAVVDLDGDCLADLFLVCAYGNTDNQSYQIWRNSKTQGFRLAKSDDLPPGTQSVTFADIDRDGTIDMIFMTCNSVTGSSGIGSNCALNIAYNKQLPPCASSTTQDIVNGKRVCRPLDRLCVADPDFEFDLTGRNPDMLQAIPLTSLVPSASAILLIDTTFSASKLPIPLRVGDIDLDGFPDLVFIRVEAPTSKTTQFTPTMLMNLPCGTAGSVGCEKGGRRAWRMVQTGAGPLNEIKDARGVAFMDIDEDGSLDLLVQRTGKDGKGTLTFVQNNFYHDAFFLKAIVLNSPCPGGWCTAPNGSTYHPYGVSYSGGTFKYTVIGTTGSRSAAQVAQLPQTAYQALHAPYAFLGLGRTNNYIEALFVGSTSHAQAHYTALEGVVPNSRVVTLPPRPGLNGQDDGAWRTELFLRPGSWIHWVGATVIITLIMLSGIVAGLHVAEKRADEKERRLASHHINFDAL